MNCAVDCFKVIRLLLVFSSAILSALTSTVTLRVEDLKHYSYAYRLSKTGLTAVYFVSIVYNFILLIKTAVYPLR